MRSKVLERALQAAWDAGKDPFDDEQVLRLLEANPEALGEIAYWRRSLQLLQQRAPHAIRQPATRQPAIRRLAIRRLAKLHTVAAAVVIAALGLLLWQAKTTTAVPERMPTNDTQAATASATPRLRVRSSRFEQRVEHHGSACAVHVFTMHTTSLQPTSAAINPRLLSKLTLRTQTSLPRKPH